MSPLAACLLISAGPLAALAHVLSLSRQPAGLLAGLTLCLLPSWGFRLHGKLLDFKYSGDMSHFMISWALCHERRGLTTLQFTWKPCEQRGGVRAGWGLGPPHRPGFSGLPTVVKLGDREALLREREEKRQVSGSGMAAC